MPDGVLKQFDPAPPPVNKDPLPVLWRRFGRADQNTILDYVRANRIDLVVNLRKHHPALDGDYFAFRDKARRAGLDCWDLHELSGPVLGQPFLRQCLALFARHGVALPEPEPVWLAPTRREPAVPTVGVFVGASASVKRWRARAWSALIDRILDARPDVAVRVASGSAPAERQLLDETIAGCAGARVSVDDIAGIDALVSWIGGLTVLVTGDTAAAHIAAAQGGRVVGLYFSTLAGIWGPLPADDLVLLQSRIGERCPEMQVNGTCRRMYSTCPAPCQQGVRPEVAATAALDLLARAGRTRPAAAAQPPPDPPSRRNVLGGTG